MIEFSQFDREVSDTEPLLRRAAPFLRLPGTREEPVEISPDGLRSRRSGDFFPYRDGILDLLRTPEPLTVSQWSLNTRFTAWAYDRGRSLIMRLAGMPSFSEEVAMIRERLGPRPGDVVVDVACGHGNFTVEWAKIVGPEGLVLGIDISRPMLERAVRRLGDAELANVLLIRASAQDLPLADASIKKVNCSGGFHAFPDLPQALSEISRVSAEGAVLTASMFAEAPDHQHPRLREWLRQRFGLHFVPLLWLGEQLELVGYTDYRWSVPRLGFGYVSAHRPEERDAA